MTTFSTRRSASRSRLLTPLLAPVVVTDPSVVETPRLMLRPLVESDREGYIALLRESRRSLAEFFPLHLPGESDEAHFERRLALSHAALSTQRAWRRVVCLRDGTIIGAVNLNDVTDHPTPSAELNFWFSPRFAGKGFATEAVSAAIEHASGAPPRGLGLERIWGYVAPGNEGCLRLISRLGFTRDPRALPVQLNLSGRWKTHHVYQRTARHATILYVTPLRIVAV